MELLTELTRTEGIILRMRDKHKLNRDLPHERATAIDLFSGCGGLTCGLKKAGFQVLAAVENEPLAQRTYGLNHPEVALWKQDIRFVTVDSVLSKLGLRPGDLDLLAGCPPCQGFSTLRNLNGGHIVHDDRNDLVYEYLRFALELRPKTLMMENVPALADDNRMKSILGELEASGYHCRVEIVDVADFGVPQRRRRMLLLAGRDELVPFARQARRRKTVADAILGLEEPEYSKDPLHNHGEIRSEAVRRRIASIPKNGGSRSSLAKANQLDCHRRCRGFHDVYGRMCWENQSPTITTGCINPSKGRFLHPEQNRAVTLREAALLQTFPRRYKFSLDRGKYRTAVLIGNALPPEFVRRQAAQVLRHLSRRKDTGIS